MKLKKRKIKFAAIFGVLWFAFLVLIVDGILKFQTLVDYVGSYAVVEISLILLVILPTVAAYTLGSEASVAYRKRFFKESCRTVVVEDKLALASRPFPADGYLNQA